MMRNNINTNWQLIIKFSEDLLDMAKSSRWENMPDIANRRDALIRDFFNAHRINSGNAKKMQTHIKHIMVIDNEIMSIKNNARSNLDGEMSDFLKSANAAQAYSSCP